MFNNKTFYLKIAIYLVLLYLIFYTFYGKKSLLHWIKLKGQITNLHYKLDKLQIKRFALEKYIYNLSNNNLDIDIVEEISKRKLFLSKSNEFIIMVQNNE
jgi:cell division protein FtsB